MKNRKTIVGLFLLVAILLIGIGYAAFTDTLSIIGNAHIDLNEAGTTAAAVTIIEMTDGAFFVEELNEQKEVILNRSFAFMIYDTETETPLFIGKVAQL